METLSKEQTLSIHSGAFTANENFTGYTSKGKRVHIFQRQMEAMGMGTKETVKFPFFVIAEAKSYEARKNEKGEVVGTPVIDRLTALSAFASKEQLAEAVNSDRLLDAEIENAFATKAKALGLDAKQIAALATASVI